MGFHQQKPDHSLIIMRLYINKNNKHLLILPSIYYSATKIRTTIFLIDNQRCLNRNKIIINIGAYVYLAPYVSL